MNYQINKSFEDYSHPINKGWVTLVADKPMHPSVITYPITWTGFVSNNKVEIIQLGERSASLDDFEFKVYPEKFSYIKDRIVDWIDDYLRILD